MPKQKRRSQFVKILCISALIPLILLGLVLILLQLSARSKGLPHNPKGYALAAQNVVTKCAKARVKRTCYEHEILILMDSPNRYSMEEGFKVIDIIHQQDKEYVYCHDIGHFLSAKETKRNPDNWTSVIARCPSGVCGNGCIHGALQERFGAEVLTDTQVTKNMNTFKTVCDIRPGWKPAEVEQAACFHGMGHMTMYLARGNAVKAAALCDTLLGRYKGTQAPLLCYDGVFMSIVEPLEPSDVLSFSTKLLAKDTALPFCDSFSIEKKASCLNQASHLFTEDLRTPWGPQTYCGRVGKNQALTDRCYDIVWYRLIRDYNLELSKIKDICSHVMPEGLQTKCFRGIAVHMIETDWRSIPQAVGLCENVKNAPDKKSCYDGLYTYVFFGFPQGSTGQKNLCNSLPKAWKDQCVSRLAAHKTTPYDTYKNW